MNYVNFTSQCGLLNKENGKKIETSGRAITFETKLYRLVHSLGQIATMYKQFGPLRKGRAIFIDCCRFSIASGTFN